MPRQVLLTIYVSDKDFSENGKHILFPITFQKIVRFWNNVW